MGDLHSVVPVLAPLSCTHCVHKEGSHHPGQARTVDNTGSTGWETSAIKFKGGSGFEVFGPSDRVSIMEGHHIPVSHFRTAKTAGLPNRLTLGHHAPLGAAFLSGGAMRAGERERERERESERVWGRPHPCAAKHPCRALVSC